MEEYFGKLGVLHQPEQVTKAGQVGHVTAIFGHVVQNAPVSMVTHAVIMSTCTVTMETTAWMETKMSDTLAGWGGGGSRLYYIVGFHPPSEGVPSRVRGALPENKKKFQ